MIGLVRGSLAQSGIMDFSEPWSTQKKVKGLCLHARHFCETEHSFTARQVELEAHGIFLQQIGATETLVELPAESWAKDGNLQDKKTFCTFDATCGTGHRTL